MKSLIPTARALTDPGEIVALATRYGHDGVRVGHYCEFYIAPANRLASAGRASEGRLIMQAGMDEGHVTWPQMAAWEGFVKHTEANPVATDNTKEVLTMQEIKTQGNFMVYGPEGECRAAFAVESDRRQFEATKGLVETCQMVVGCIGDNLGSHFPDYELQPALDALEIALEPFKQPPPAPSKEQDDRT